MAPVLPPLSTTISSKLHHDQATSMPDNNNNYFTISHFESSPSSPSSASSSSYSSSSSTDMEEDLLPTYSSIQLSGSSASESFLAMAATQSTGFRLPLRSTSMREPVNLPRTSSVHDNQGRVERVKSMLRSGYNTSPLTPPPEAVLRKSPAEKRWEEAEEREAKMITMMTTAKKKTLDDDQMKKTKIMAMVMAMNMTEDKQELEQKHDLLQPGLFPQQRSQSMRLDNGDGHGHRYFRRWEAEAPLTQYSYLQENHNPQREFTMEGNYQQCRNVVDRCRDIGVKKAEEERKIMKKNQKLWNMAAQEGREGGVRAGDNGGSSMATLLLRSMSMRSSGSKPGASIGNVLMGTSCANCGSRFCQVNNPLPHASLSAANTGYVDEADDGDGSINPAAAASSSTTTTTTRAESSSMKENSGKKKKKKKSLLGACRSFLRHLSFR